MLIITWDEHGGFYDHVLPPPIPPGGTPQMPNLNNFGFVFVQYGPRVLAVVISPLVPRNTVDQRPYDHASIPATVERPFNLPPLTARDRAARDLLSLASLPEAREVGVFFDSLPADDEAALAGAPLDKLEVELPDLGPEAISARRAEAPRRRRPTRQIPEAEFPPSP